jgi:hypothetical protein
MWQRIQTLYLALVALLYVILLFLPIASFKGENFELQFGLFKTIKIAGENQEKVSTHILLLLICAFIIATALFCIYQFKNRRFQIKIAGLLYLLNAAFLVIEYFLQENILKQFTIETKTYLVGTYLPLIALLLIFLAQRGIKQDEELVKSADRLR